MSVRQYNKPYTNAEIITPGTPVRGRHSGCFIACTVAGNVRLKLSGGGAADILDVPVNVGANMIDGIDVTDVVAGSTTATAVVTVLS